MAIEPRKAGQCWSCKYCEDIGTQTYEDYVTYIRKCNHSRHDYIDKCERRCDHYVWDGTTREFWRESSSHSSSYSASHANSSSAAGASSSAGSTNTASDGSGAAILVIAAAVVLMGMILFFLFRPAKDAAEPLHMDASGNFSTAPTEDLADYSLAGAIRIVSTQSGNGINMRESARADASIISGIPENQVVTIQKAIDNWAYVAYGGYEGWCNMDYLITEEAHAQLMQEYLNVPAIVATQTDPLRLRATPSLNSEAIESMPKGSQVIVLRLEGEWAYVEYQGMSGWCASEYLDIQE